LPVDFRITAGQAAEYAQAILLLEGQQAEAVIADKGYDSAEIVAKVHGLGAVAVIPPRRHWKQPRTYDRQLYKQRNRIERCFNRLKHFRRFSTRYCRTIEAFRSITALACADQTSAICGYRLEPRDGHRDAAGDLKQNRCQLID
jgi:transposase